VFVIGRAAENRHPLFGPPDLFEYSRVRTENRFALFLAGARGWGLSGGPRKTGSHFSCAMTFWMLARPDGKPLRTFPGRRERVELIRQAGENGTILLSADDAIARGDSDSTTCCSMTTLED
jgi:hypothetical protein